MTKFFAILSALMFVAAATQVHAADRPEPKTEAAVLAADDDWLAAERRGDVAALDARLAPGYRDILPDGSVHLKAHMLEATANRKNKSTLPAKQLAAEFRAAHPIVEKVVILGDTAILTFHSVDPAKQAIVLSTDVFAYDHGKWRGMLSMQSGATPPT
jgi:hypothetical protein